MQLMVKPVRTIHEFILAGFTVDKAGRLHVLGVSSGNTSYISVFDKYAVIDDTDEVRRLVRDGDLILLGEIE